MQFASVYVIVLVPKAAPYARPDAEPIVTLVVLLLVHVPPSVGSVSDVFSPRHML